MPKTGPHFLPPSFECFDVIAGKGRHLQPGSMPLTKKDEGLVRLFMTACYHQWDKLPLAGRTCLEIGAAHAEVQGCIRHMVV